MIQTDKALNNGEYKRNDSRSVWGRLRNCIQADRQLLRTPRNNRKAFIRQSVGNYYSDYGTNSPVPHNNMALFRRVYSRLLGAHEPAVVISTPYPELRKLAARSEVGINNQINSMDFGSTLEEAIVDSLFFWGIIKTGYEESGVAPIHDNAGNVIATVPVGEVFCERVSPDNWVHDMKTERIEDGLYMGDLFFMPIEEALNSEDFDPKIRQQLKKTEMLITNETGDKRTSSLSRGNNDYDQQLVDQVALWSIFMPRDQLIVVLPFDGPQEPLKIVEWTGPEDGPYDFLKYEDVPDNSLPSSPASHIMAAHEATNEILKKMYDDTLDEKDILAYSGEAEEDAENITRAGNRATVKVNDPDGIREMHFGGASQQAMGAYMAFTELLDQQAGGLRVLSGTRDLGDTATEASIVKGANSEQLKDMKKVFFKFTKKIIKKISYYWWHDDIRDYQGSIDVPGTGVKISFTVRPEDRRENWSNLNFDVQPFSLQSQSPIERMDFLLSFLDRVLLPLASLDQTIIPDTKTIISLFAKWSGIPELADTAKFQDGSLIEAPDRPAGKMPSASIGGKPNGEYHRHSTSGNSQTKMMETVQGLMANAEEN